MSHRRPALQKTQRRSPPKATAAAAAPPEVRKAVRRFARAFAGYELGRLTPTVRRELRASATETLTDELLAQPPRARAAMRAPRHPARLAALGVQSVRSARIEVVALLARAHGQSETLRISLRRTPEGWRVGALR